MFAFWRRKRSLSQQAAGRYAEIVAHALQPAFFQIGAAADDIDGRFDMVSLLLSLYVNALSDDLETPKGFVREIEGVFFANMDRELREMGVGDLSVGKHVKKMAGAFYGRRQAYGEALKAGDRGALIAALGRNLYRGRAVEETGPAWMADYMAQQFHAFAAAGAARLMDGPLPLVPPREQERTAG